MPKDNTPQYSVAIRTIGRAGEKYQKLINSIKQSKIQPRDIIVVLPEGYPYPKERFGNEKFVFSPKSMILQRIEALKHIQTEYTLFLDDDIEFDSDFVGKLLEPIMSGKYDCSTGPLFSFFPASIPGTIAGTLTASVSISLFHRDMYVKILRSGGWAYHRFDTNVKRYYPTESFAWACFMIRTDVMRNIHMEDEQIWLERFKYACGDDRVMSYKLCKRGYHACIVSNALYIHNDARTSTSSKEINKNIPKFCMYYMHAVFWKRFIQDLETNRFGRILNDAAYLYWKYSMQFYLIFKGTSSKNRWLLETFREGVTEGERYTHSEEYKKLSSVIDG